MNNRDRNFTKNKIASRLAHLEADVERYIDKMVRIDRQEEGEARAEKVQHAPRRYGRIRQEIARLKAMDRALANTPDGQISLTDPDARAMATSARHSGMVGCNVRDAPSIPRPTSSSPTRSPIRASTATNSALWPLPPKTRWSAKTCT